MQNAKYDFPMGFRIAPDAAPSAFDAKAPYIDFGTGPINTRRYLSADYMVKEWDKLWTKIWVMAGVECDVREPGDFFKFDLGHESFIIVRGEDMKLRAFYNVCAHRGLQLIQSDHGSVSSKFTCPYHRWSYHLDGELASITDRETFRPQALCRNPKLKEVRCETAAGFVFISMNPAPVPLMEFLGVFGEHMCTYDAQDMIVVRHTRAEVACNWKTGVDSFLEGYHFHAIHQEVLPLLDDYHVQQDMYPGGASRLIVQQGVPSPRLEDRHQVTPMLKMLMEDSGMDPDSYKGNALDIRREAQRSKRERAASLGLDYSKLSDAQLTDSYVYGAFPNIILGAHAEAIPIHRFLPHETDVGRHYFDTITLYRPAKRVDGTYVMPTWMGFPKEQILTKDSPRPDVEVYPVGNCKGMGMVLEQDVDMQVLVQRGMQSEGFDGAVLGEQEQRIRQFHAELDKYIGAES